MKLELQKLNFKEYAEFIGYENGIEVTIIVPNHKALVQAMKEQSWIFVKFTCKEDIM